RLHRVAVSVESQQSPAALRRAVAQHEHAFQHQALRESPAFLQLRCSSSTPENQLPAQLYRYSVSSNAPAPAHQVSARRVLRPSPAGCGRSLPTLWFVAAKSLSANRLPLAGTE